MFAALGLHSFPIAKGDQLCHARNLSRVLCPQKTSIPAEDDAPEEDGEEEEDEEGGCGCHENAMEDSSIQISKRLIQVAVRRDGDGTLGLTLCGGACADNPTFSRPLVVSQVCPGGPAYREGSIRPGDRLLAVDGHSTEHATLAEAQALLLHHSHCICWDTKREDAECSEGSMPCCSEDCCTLLVIEYDVVIRHGLSESPGPFLVELQMEHPTEELGLSLAMLPEEGGPIMSPSRPAALVEAVRPASIAERCGALHPGDILLSIGEVHRRAVDKVAYEGGSPHLGTPWVLHMEVLPLSLEGNGHHKKSRCDSRRGALDASRALVCTDAAEPLPCEASSGNSSSRSSSLVWNMHQGRGQRWGPLVSAPSPLQTMQGSSNKNAISQTGIHSSPINIIPGEEILQLEEFLQAADVRTSEQGERIVPQQIGSFQSLGVAILDHDNEGIIPEESSEGRSMCQIQPLAWSGSSPLATGVCDPLEEGEENCKAGNSIAGGYFTLLPFAEEDKEMEVYVVQVPREGGPLGITLSGTEDPHEYVTISGLVEGGPAKRTAALDVGDRLLAVGGESLVGRPLSEAVALLRAASDPVVLHVARPLSRLQVHTPSSIRLDTTGTMTSGRIGCEGLLLDLLSDAMEDSSMAINRRECQGEAVAADQSSVTICSPSLPCRPQPSQLGSRGSSSHLSLANVLHRPVSYDSDQQSSLNHSSRGSVGTVGSTRGGSNFQPVHTETLRLTLFKDSIYEDFGFSVSDGLYERGVYVNRIRKGGPADIGSLQPYDRIIQVNDTMTFAFDCCLTVPLIASAGDKIDLTIVRSS